MNNNVVENVEKVIRDISFDIDKFTPWWSEEKIIIGELSTNPKTKQFWAISTILKSIVDVDLKIKYSLHLAAELAEVEDFKALNPFKTPPENESLAHYYVENAVFRLEILWDLLAQFYNVLIENGTPPDKIYSTQFFHNLQQGDTPDEFAKRVYEYFNEEDDENGDTWTGNHAFLKDFRNKLTHRCSPNVTSINNFALELRLPAALVLDRLVLDYRQAAMYINELINDIEIVNE